MPGQTGDWHIWMYGFHWQNKNFLLPPSIDFEEMEARQSDIRNKIIAPVFKKMGIIDPWGNGLKIIAEELRRYPEIDFKWFEKGLQFQVQFIRKEYVPEQDILEEINRLGEALGAKFALSWNPADRKLVFTRY